MKRKKHFARPNFFSRKYAMLGRIAKQTRLLRDIRFFFIALLLTKKARRTRTGLFFVMFM